MQILLKLVAENPIPEEDHNISRDSDGERRVATPTATESQLPWKRQGDELTDAVQQNEFPAWASNKEYLAYNSPSATFLGMFCFIFDNIGTTASHEIKYKYI